MDRKGFNKMKILLDTISSYARNISPFLSRRAPQSQAFPPNLLVPAIILMAIALWFYASSGNQLNAKVSWETLAPGISRMAITNNSNKEWTDVRVIIDERFYYTSERVESDRTLLLTTAHFEEGHVLPRAPGLFPYERDPDLALSAQQTPGEVGEMPPDYQPEYVIIASDQGLFTSPIQP